MDYRKEFTALADLALIAGLITPDQIAMINRRGTRKSVFIRRHLIDLVGFLRDKIKLIPESGRSQNELIPLVECVLDAFEETMHDTKTDSV